MIAKFFNGSLALLVFGATISVGAGAVRAQYGDTPSGPPPQQAAPADKSKPTGPPVNKDEEKAYKAFLASRSGPPDAQIKLGEEFVAKYPQSHYAGGVYGTLTSLYFSSNQVDKMTAAGDKALQLNPDNVDVLSLLAMSIPRRARSTSPDFAQQLQKAEAYGHHAVELIPNLPKPPDLDDAAFEKAKNEKLSLAHSGLGLIDIDHSKYEDARTELMLAVQLESNPDPVDYYLLGNADSAASYYKDAAEAYEKCATSGPLVAQCKAGAEKAKTDSTTKLGR